MYRFTHFYPPHISLISYRCRWRNKIVLKIQLNVVRDYAYIDIIKVHAAVEIDRKWIGGWESVKAVWYMYRNQISRLYRSQIPYTGSSTRNKGEVPVISTNNRKKLYQTLLTNTFLILWKHFNFKSWICRLKELCTFIYKICLLLN